MLYIIIIKQDTNNNMKSAPLSVNKRKLYNMYIQHTKYNSNSNNKINTHNFHTLIIKTKINYFNQSL